MSALQRHEFEPDWIVHPGELLHEELTERGMSQADLSRRTGLTQKHISMIVRGHALIGPSAAVMIGRALGISPRVLARLSSDYEVGLYEGKRSLL